MVLQRRTASALREHSTGSARRADASLYAWTAAWTAVRIMGITLAKTLANFRIYRALGNDLEHLADDLLPLRLPLALEPEVGVEVRLDVGDALEEVAAADDVPVLGVA